MYRVERPLCVIVQKLAAIGNTVTEISRYFLVSIWRPSVILGFVKFRDFNKSFKLSGMVDHMTRDV